MGMENIQSIFRLLPRVKSVINKVISNLNFWWVSFCYIFVILPSLDSILFFLRKESKKQKNFWGECHSPRGEDCGIITGKLRRKTEEGGLYMAKLYFRYGVMGSSKSAQALITKFNYEEQGMRVWLMKPAADMRYGADKVHSRIGLEQPADVIDDDMDLYEVFRDREREFYDVIIVDEAQFLQPAHVEQLREIVDYYNVPVFCFGLRTDFRTRLFPGSARLFELADSVTELKTVCTCGGKAMVNARIDAEGRVVTEGEQFLLGGNESYRPMCYKCWKKAALESKSEK